MDDRTTGDSPHEILLALAGRIDDDLLAWCRELVAVGEDGRALELITGTLVADGTALPPRDRAAVVAAARAARTDLDVDAALPPAAAETDTAHRFAAGPGVEHLAAAVGALPERLVAGCRTWVTFRTTPAGSAPGPLPQPVVVVEVAADDQRPVDVLGYQLAIACARVGAPSAVEVVVAGSARPGYQRAALASAVPVHGADDDTGSASADTDTDTFAAQSPAPSPSPGSESSESEAETPASGIPESSGASAWPSLGSLVMPPPVRAFRSPEPDPAPLDRRSRREARDSAEARAEGSWDFGADRATPAGGTPVVRPFASDADGSALFGGSGAEPDTADRASAHDTGAGRGDADRPDTGRSDTGGPGAARPDADRLDADRLDTDRPDADRLDADHLDVDRPDADRADADRADADPAAGITAAADRSLDGPDTDRPAPEPSPTDRAATDRAATEQDATERDAAEWDAADWDGVDRPATGPGRAEPAPADPDRGDAAEQPLSGWPALARSRSAALAAASSFGPTEDAADAAHRDGDLDTDLDTDHAADTEPAVPVPVTPLRSRTDLPRPRPTAVPPLPRPTDQEPPGPTPFGRRRPLAPVADFPRHPGPPAGSDSPALASIGDPFGGPVDDREASRTLPPIDEADPLGIGRLPVEHDAAHRAGGEDAGEPAPPVSDDWLADWISGDWAISRSTSSPDPLDPDQPLPGLSAPVEDAPASPEPPRPVPRPAPQPSARPVPRPSPVRPPAPAAPAPSETAARLSDADRDLLARLQSELGGGDAPRPRVSRRAGIAGENGNGAPNGRGPHPPPPDIAG